MEYWVDQLNLFVLDCLIFLVFSRLQVLNFVSLIFLVSLIDCGTSTCLVK